MRLAAIRQAIYRRYGRCFAEFLNEGSLVHLSALRAHPPVSVSGTVILWIGFLLFLGTTYALIGFALLLGLQPPRLATEQLRM